MQRMRVGTERKVIIPAYLAYGKRGKGCSNGGVNCIIPPNSKLELTMEVLKIDKAIQLDDGYFRRQTAIDKADAKSSLKLPALIATMLFCSVIVGRHRLFAANTRV